MDDGTHEIFESRALPDERCLSLLCEESRAVDAFSAKSGDGETRCMSSRLRRRVARIAAAGDDGRTPSSQREVADLSGEDTGCVAAPTRNRGRWGGSPRLVERQPPPPPPPPAPLVPASRQLTPPAPKPNQGLCLGDVGAQLL
jgi:hypothetical protein